MGSRIPSINSRYIRILLAAHVSLIFQDAFKPGTWGAMSQPPPTRMRAGWAFSAGCILRLCLFKITQGNKEWALKMAAPQTKQHWTYHFTLKTHVFLDLYVTFAGGLVYLVYFLCLLYANPNIASLWTVKSANFHFGWMRLQKCSLTRSAVKPKKTTRSAIHVVIEK